jgi:hypothetical protein
MKHPTLVPLAAALIGSSIPAAAQESAVRVDSAHAQIRTTLRAFYFNLARRDWEALAADILSAKVMASHPVPAAVLSQHPARTEQPKVCPPDASTRVDRATIVLEADWAYAAVPNCPSAGAADEFRLVRFERRWRIIYIHLRQEASEVQLAR